METLDILKSKIITDNQELARIIYRNRFFNKKVIFTNGCFDILHRGHVEYLTKAADLGDILIVGLNSDESVKRIKGVNRPILDQQTRSLILASFTFINYVVIFKEDTPEEIIKIIKPDVLVKGGDYTEIEKIVGYDIVKANKGEIITIPLIEGYSTTEIIRKITQI